MKIKAIENYLIKQVLSKTVDNEKIYFQTEEKIKFSEFNFGQPTKLENIKKISCESFDLNLELYSNLDFDYINQILVINNRKTVIISKSI